MALRTEARKPLYAVVGAGDLAVANIKELPGTLLAQAAGLPGKAFATYGLLVDRGQQLVGSIRKGSATQKAGSQIKVAKAQAKAATTSVTKAAKATAKAANDAVEKIG